jgi:carbamoyl-phosphate synthase large subunit
MRLTSRGPVTIEINPRFAGGAAMCAHFGFNEIEMSIRDLVLDEAVPEPQIAVGTAQRYWEEAYFDEATNSDDAGSSFS